MPVNPTGDAPDADYDAASAFLAAVSAALGDAIVDAGDATRARYARSTSARPVTPAAILYPTTTQQVQQIVRLATEHRVPLHPISRGRNWGYGDACPPGEGQVIVDLGGMNRILEVDEKLAYAVIEPGVTQGQLWDFLQEHDLPLWVDSTGAGREASLVGNILDRGFGHTPYGDHCATVCGMTVVLGTGEVIETGMGRFPGSKAHRVYRYGVGPHLDGLFQQSNFGIVTRVGLWLMPRPEASCAFFLSGKRESDLEHIVDALRPLRLSGLLPSAIHIGNDLRVISARMRYPWDRAGGVTPLPEELRAELRKEAGIGAWNVAGCLYGTVGTVREVKRVLRRAVSPLKPTFVDNRAIFAGRAVGRVLGVVGRGQGLGELLDLAEPTYRLMQGEPTDEPLRGVRWRVRGDVPDEPSDPREVHAGVMWVSPVLPAAGAEARAVMDLVEPIYIRHGFEPLVTFTMINERAMICVTNLYFDTRETAEAEAAKKCYGELGETLLAGGYVPYRTGPVGYRKLRESPGGIDAVMEKLKQALDPSGVITPGRYGIGMEEGSKIDE